MYHLNRTLVIFPLDWNRRLFSLRIPSYGLVREAIVHYHRPVGEPADREDEYHDLIPLCLNLLIPNKRD